MTVIAYDIKWDTSDWDEEEELASGTCVPDLPAEMDAEVPQEILDKADEAMRDASIEDWLSDWLTDETGYCHDGFKWRIEDEG